MARRWEHCSVDDVFNFPLFECFLVIDVRPKQVYDKGHLQTARNFPALSPSPSCVLSVAERLREFLDDELDDNPPERMDKILVYGGSCPPDCHSTITGVASRSTPSTPSVPSMPTPSSSPSWSALPSSKPLASPSSALSPPSSTASCSSLSLQLSKPPSPPSSSSSSPPSSSPRCEKCSVHAIQVLSLLTNACQGDEPHDAHHLNEREDLTEKQDEAAARALRHKRRRIEALQRRRLQLRQARVLYLDKTPTRLKEGNTTNGRLEKEATPFGHGCPIQDCGYEAVLRAYPFLVGQWAEESYPGLVPGVPGLFIGSALHATSHAVFEHLELTHVVNATVEVRHLYDKKSVTLSPGTRSAQSASQLSEGKTPTGCVVRYLRLSIIDDTSQDLSHALEMSSQFLTEALNANKNVLVHCQQGKSRSASVIIAYLMRAKGLSYDSALHRLRQARAIACPNDYFEAQLRAWR